eukprot:gene11229-13094_t
MKVTLFAVLALVCLVNAQPPPPDHCFDATGYTSWFGVSAFNTYFPNGAGANQLFSFYESGNMSTDFVGQRMRVDYEIVMAEATVAGSLWAFQKTNEMYQLSNGQCVHTALEFPVPTGFPMNASQFIGFGKIGQFTCEVYYLEAGNTGGLSPLVNQTVLYDPKSCSVVSSTLKNANPATPGYSTMEYYDFRNFPEEHYFDLPAVCTAAKSKNLARKHTPKNIIPKVVYML